MSDVPSASSPVRDSLPPPEDDRRQLLAREESELLRRELLRYLREEIPPGELLDPLRPMVRRLLQEQAGRALADLGLEKRVHGEVQSLINREAETVRKRLRDDIRSEVRNAIREEAGKAPPPKVATARRPIRESSRPMAASPDFGDRLFRRTAVVLVTLMATAVLGVMGVKIAERYGFLAGGESRPEWTPSTAEELAALPHEWQDLMNPVSNTLSSSGPLWSHLEERPLDKHFSCWFPDDTERRLEALLGSGITDPELFRMAVRGAFDVCVSRDPPSYEPSILGAQAAVVKLLQAKTGSGWDEWCPGVNEPDRTLLRALPLDGTPNPATQAVLNLYLDCKGQSKRLRIDSSSEAGEYLFVLYLALHDLRREP